LIFAATVLASAVPASAETIIGRFNETFGTVVVSLGEIDFTPTNPGVDATPTSGSFTVNPTVGSRSGSFLDPVFNTLPSDGTIGDLSSNPADANYVPVGTPVSRSNYITLAEKPTWEFTLTELEEGDLIMGVPSPFVFTQSGPNVSVTITQNGTAIDTGDPLSQQTLWTNIVSAQYTNTTIQQLIDFVLANGVLPENTWSGTFEAVAGPSEVPEPATLLTFGVGTAILAARRRRKASKAE
jgi:hypothetical protein